MFELANGRKFHIVSESDASESFRTHTQIMVYSWIYIYICPTAKMSIR